MKTILQLLSIGALVVVGAWTVRLFWKPWPEPRAPAASSPRPPVAPAARPEPVVLSEAELGARVAAERALAAALALKSKGKWLEARAALRAFLDGSPSGEHRAEAETLLGEVNMRILLGRIPAPEKIEQVVVTGDTLGKISAQHNVPIALLVQSNGLKDERDIRPGSRLLIYPAAFSVLVEKTKFSLTLLDHGRFFKRYAVGVGAADSTPTGEFRLVDRIAEPTWYRAEDRKAIPFGDPENILGTHWLALNIPNYGIHGTWEPDSIGKASSRGCIRLLNRDIEELYTILPRGTPVRIVN